MSRSWLLYLDDLFALDPEIMWEVATVHVPALLAEARRLEADT